MPPPPSRRSVLAGAGVLAADGLAGCGRDYAVCFPYRYALTLEVVANGVLHRRTNVVAVERHVRPPAPGVEGVGAILGAVAMGGPNRLDLGPGRPLIALLTRLKAIDEPRPQRHWDFLTPEPVLARIYGIAADDGWDEVTGSAMLAAIVRARGAHDIGLDDLPSLATYAKPGAPQAGLVDVDPYDLAPVFGPGAAIRRATLEVTRRMITLSHLQRIESTRSDAASAAKWRPAARL